MEAIAQSTHDFTIVLEDLNNCCSLNKSLAKTWTNETDPTETFTCKVTCNESYITLVLTNSGGYFVSFAIQVKGSKKFNDLMKKSYSNSRDGVVLDKSQLQPYLINGDLTVTLYLNSNVHPLTLKSISLIQNEFSDVEIEMESGEILYAHKCILCSASLVLKTILNNENESAASKIVVDAPKEIMIALLSFIYETPKTLAEFTLPSGFDLSKLALLARKYEMRRLLAFCELKMLEGIRVDNCLEKLKVSIDNEFDLLKSRVLEWMNRNRASVIATNILKFIQVFGQEDAMDLIEIINTPLK